MRPSTIITTTIVTTSPALWVYGRIFQVYATPSTTLGGFCTASRSKKSRPSSLVVAQQEDDHHWDREEEENTSSQESSHLTITTNTNNTNNSQSQQSTLKAYGFMLPHGSCVRKECQVFKEDIDASIP
jgi:hypothetical protein